MAPDARPVALITGCSSGIGLLCAVELAKARYRVFATMRNLQRRAALDLATKAAGVEVTVLPLDVTAPASIASALATIGAEVAHLDLLVNNAGIAIAGFAEDLSLAEMREQLETNFFGLVSMTQAVLPQMRQRRAGRIINISSISGRMALPGLSAYCAAKFAVEGYSEALRYETLPHGLFVSLVEPGCFKTNIYDVNRRVAERTKDPASPYHAAFLRGEKALQRILEVNPQDPLEVARLVVKVARAKRPHLRYLVGKDAHAEFWAGALVPRRLLEPVMLRLSGSVE